MSNEELAQSPAIKPRFFYGYVVVILAFLILVVTFGPHSAFGLFFNPLIAEFGWTRAQTSLAFSLSMFIYGVLGVAMGGLTDRFGPRLVVTICGILIGLGYLLMSQVNSICQLYLYLGVIVGVGMSGVWVPQMSSIARWFVKRRSLMTGIAVAGTGISQLLTPPIISRMIAVYDWRLSYIILGGVILIAMVLLAQFLRRDPARMGQRPYGEIEAKQHVLPSASNDFTFKEAVRTAQFWIVFIMLACSGVSFMAITVHIVPHTLEMGISSIGAANLLAVMGGVSILGNYVLGVVADRIGNRRVFIIGFVIMAASLFWLIFAQGLWMLYVFAVAFGFVFGGMGSVEAPLVASIFGVSSHGLIYGVVHVGFTVGAAIGPFVTGYLYDLTLSYQIAFLVCAAFGIIGIIVTAILRPTKKRWATI